MIARILIPVVLFTVLPYLWIDRRYLRLRRGWRKMAYWLPAAIVIGYSGVLSLDSDFLPDEAVLIDVWFGVMALLAVPQFVFAFCSFVFWAGGRLSRRIGRWRRGKGKSCPACRPTDDGQAAVVSPSRDWGKMVGLALAVASFFVFVYGFTWGFRKLEVRHLTITVPDLPPAFDGYRIVQFSDIHLGSYYGWRADLPQRDVDSINAQRADLICFTGDLQNVKPDELPPYLRLLSTLRARDGVLSILGNHDYTYYMGLDDEREKLAVERRLQHMERGMGWRLLMNEHIVLRRGGDSIFVAGTENFKKPERAEVARSLYGIPRGQFVLMLQHMPEMWKGMLPSTINEEHGSPDSVLFAPQLTLSGHTHGGQVRVLGLRPSMFSPFDYGLYEREGCQLYTTSGLGGTIPIRVGATAEIVVITLRRK